jgi:prevent-host-death family protein
MMTMQTNSASIMDLKTHMGRYLARVKRGETIVVTSHRHPVARLMGVEAETGGLSLIPPERPLSDLASISPLQLSGVVDGVDVLLADRQRRR